MKPVNKKIKVEPEDESQDSPEMEQSKKEMNKLKSRKSRVKSKTSKELTVEYLKSAMAFLATASGINFMDLSDNAHDLFQKLVLTKQELTSEAPSRSAADEHINKLAKQLYDVCGEFSRLSQKKQSKKRKSESIEDVEDDAPEVKRPRKSVDETLVTPIHADHVKLPENAIVNVYLNQTINSVTVGDKVLVSADITEKLVESPCEPNENENLKSHADVDQDHKPESDRVVVEIGNENCVRVPDSNGLPEAYPNDSLRFGGWNIPIKKLPAEDDERSETSHLETGASAYVVLDTSEPCDEESEPGMAEGDESTGLVYHNSGEDLNEEDGQVCNVEEKNQTNPIGLSSEALPDLQDLIQSELDDPDCKCV